MFSLYKYNIKQKVVLFLFSAVLILLRQMRISLKIDLCYENRNEQLNVLCTEAFCTQLFIWHLSKKKKN